LSSTKLSITLIVQHVVMFNLCDVCLRVDLGRLLQYSNNLVTGYMFGGGGIPPVGGHAQEPLNLHKLSDTASAASVTSGDQLQRHSVDRGERTVDQQVFN